MKNRSVGLVIALAVSTFSFGMGQAVAQARSDRPSEPRRVSPVPARAVEGAPRLDAQQLLSIASARTLPKAASPADRRRAQVVIRRLGAGDTDAAMKSWEQALANMTPEYRAQYRESTMDFILRSAYIETDSDLKYRADKVKFYNEQKKAAFKYRDELLAADITLKRGEVGTAKKPAPYSNITLKRDVVNAPAPGNTGDITLKRGVVNGPAPARTGDITLKRGVVNEPAPARTGDITLKRGVVNEPARTGDITLKRGVVKSVRVTAVELAPEYQPGVAPIASSKPEDVDIDSVVDDLQGITVLCNRVEEQERQANLDLQNALQLQNRQFNVISNVMRTNPIPPTPPKP